jgi:hypothetical protein
MKKVNAVTATKNGETYTYWAMMDEGWAIIRKSKKQYQNAFYYGDESGNSYGLGKHFSYGKQPDRYRKPALIKSYKVDFLP